MRPEYPRILTALQLYDSEQASISALTIERLIKQLLPPHFFDEEDAFHKLQQLLPMICWSPMKTPPFSMTFFLCCKSQPFSHRFFQERICKCLHPGKRFTVLYQSVVDFSFSDFRDFPLAGHLLSIPIQNERELISLQKQLPLLENDLRLGVVSEYHANRILEIKGLSSSEKSFLIQDTLSSLVKRRPQNFDYDIFEEMHLFFLSSSKVFKNTRTCKHLSRIICTHYLFRKALTLSHESFPERRYISVKLFRTRIDQDNIRKKVLGICIAVSYLQSFERFEEKHVLSAIQALVPSSLLVEGSFVSGALLNATIRTFYLEIEKDNSAPFTDHEFEKLKQKLPSTLKSHIEERHHPIFMPQNEEEILRHILALSHQLRYVQDLPQAVIVFNTQTEDSLEFLVVVLRVFKKGVRSIQTLFESKASFLTLQIDRIKTVGTLRRKYRKEATVFRVKIAKKTFLRANHSVDLYKARQEVVLELMRVMGILETLTEGRSQKRPKP